MTVCKTDSNSKTFLTPRSLQRKLLASHAAAHAIRGRARENKMSIAVKDIGTVTTKWSQRAQAAGADYKNGVTNPRNDWAANTAAASDSWGQGVSQAVANGRFSKGVAKAGNAKWQAGAVNKGAVRYPQGVAAGSTNYNAGFGPFLQTISGLTLPPRGPKGSPNNYQRVSAVGDALHRQKIGG